MLLVYVMSAYAFFGFLELLRLGMKHGRQQVSNEKVVIPEERLKELAGPTDFINWSPTKLLHEAHEMAVMIAALTAEVYALDRLHRQSQEFAAQLESNITFLNQRVAASEAELARRSAPVTEELYEDGRCQVCGWPLSKSVADGCVPESCSMRPREGSEDWFRLKERRAWLAARATPPQDVEKS